MNDDRDSAPGPPPPDEITRWLEAQDRELSDALSGLFDSLYSDLKRRAHFALRRSGSTATLDTTGLVNEAYLRLAGAGSVKIDNRRHFLSLAAKTMRWVVLDTARARKRLRRGGSLDRISFDEARVLSEARADELLALDAALERLAHLDPRLAGVVEHRFFGGLDVDDTATALGVSPRTVKRDWKTAKAFLAREMKSIGIEGEAVE